MEKMFEKARTADLGTINSIIDAVFPQVSTSFTLQEVLMYASAYSQYTLGENMGFPVDKTTDTLSGLGSIVIPQDLTSNVAKLHEFLFGTVGYTPSSTVQTINGNIISKVEAARSAPQSDVEEYDEEEEEEVYEEEYYEDTDDDSGSSTGSSGSDSSSGGSGTDSGSGGSGSGSGEESGGGSGTGSDSGGSGSGSGGESGGSGSGESGGESSGGGSGESGGSGEGTDDGAGG